MRNICILLRYKNIFHIFKQTVNKEDSASFSFGFIYREVKVFCVKVEGFGCWMQTIDLIIKRGTMEAYLAARLVLFLLATRLGTLLICGTECLVSSWPFVEKFSELSLEKRERVLQKQFRNWFLTPIRAAFVYIKVAFLFCFFSRVCLISSVFFTT